MRSLRVRLSAFLLLSAVITAIVIGAFTLRRTIAQNERLFDYQLHQTALSLRDQGMAEGWRPDAGREEALDMVVRIWAPNGAVHYLSDPDVALPTQAALGFSTVDAAGTRWRMISLVARNRIIQVAQPLALRRRLATEAALRSLSPLFAFAPLMALLGWWLTGRGLRPLKRLAREVTEREARSLRPVSEEDLPSEIAPVAHALNSLFARLSRAFAGQRAFVADAAHELRSPLTALKLQLQLLEQAGSDGERRLALEKLNDGVERAGRLIEQLLAAARTEPGDADVPMQPVDLAEAMRQVIADLFPLAQTRRIDVELDAPERAIVAGNAEQLAILMRNLVDNAIRYTPEDGTVRVAIAAAPDGVMLTVDDSGPGIPAQERKQVFRRFYRGHQNGQPGNGLGLAIVRNIADVHGASVRLGDAPLGGLRAEVAFLIGA